MEQCCDICGDIGVQEALVLCSRCKSSREHMYCMRTQIDVDSENWCCEECEPGSKPILQASSGLTEKLPDLSRPTEPVNFRNGASWGRRGAKKGSVTSVDWEKKVASGKTKYICAQEAILLSSGAKKTLPPLKNAGPSLPPRPKVGLNKLDRTPIKSRTVPSFPSQQNLASGSVLQLGSHPQPARAPLMQKEKTAEVNLAQTKGKSVMTKPSLASAPSITISGSKTCTNLEVRTRNDKNVNVNVLPDSEECIPNSGALWKGSFKIRDYLKNGELNPKIQAHPPCTVLRKVYDFSKKMPGVLSFELVPCIKLWPPEYIPDRRDIGLYFFPSDIERAEDYISLVESVCAKNLALRLQIADVELLVFTSELLSNDCRYWEGNKYLWGIFHRLRGTSTNVTNVVEEVEVDMEIDMIGGIKVGKLDVAVHREKSATAKHSLSDDIPPGFEEKSKRQVFKS